MTAELAAVAVVLVLPAVVLLGSLATIALVIATLASADDRQVEMDERRLLRGLVRS
jgi:hypothetical protein